MKSGYVLLMSIIALVLIMPSVIADPYFYESSIPHAICAGSRTAFQFYLKNNDNVQNNFNISVNSNQSYFNWIPYSVKLIPGDSVPVYVFANPGEKDYGNHSFKISAKYGIKTVSDLVNYEVVDCNKYQVSLVSDNFCTNTQIKLKGAITNLGNFNKQKIDLSVSSGIITPKTMLLNKNQSSDFNITLNPISQPISQTIEIKAYLPDKNTTIYKNISFNINNCASYNASLTTINNRTCTGESLNYAINIKNTGTSADSYTISSSKGSLDTDFINLSSGSSRTININLMPKTAGTFPIVVKIKPATGKERELVSSYSAEDCCNASLYATDSHISVCSNEPIEAAIPMKINNLGAPENFTITSSSDWAVPQDSWILLSRNTSRYFITRLGAISIPGTYHAIITASAGSCKANAYVTMNVKNCYGFSVSQSLLQSPNINEMCSCTSKPFKIIVKNTGSSSDTYTLSLLKGDPQLFSFPEQKLELTPGNQGSFDGEFNMPCSYNSTGNLVFVVSSKSNPQITKTINIVIGSKQCYSANIVMNNVDVCPNQNFNISAIITNNGNRTDNYSVNLNCPSWVSAKSYSKEITLTAQNRYVISFNGIANISDSSNTYLCGVEVKSLTNPEVNAVASSKISIDSVDKCFCYEPVLNQTSTVMSPGSSKVTSLSITNCGTNVQNYKFDITGDHSDWVIIEPSSLSIIPNGYDISYLALLPKSDAVPGTYNFTVDIKPENTGYTKKIPFTITIKKQR